MKEFQDTEIKYLKGVGEARGKELASQLDIRTFGDLMYYFPIRHADRSRIYKISELKGDMPVLQVKGMFMNFVEEESKGRKRLIGNFTDGTGFMQVVWFSKINTLRNAYVPGRNIFCSGNPHIITVIRCRIRR